MLKKVKKSEKNKFLRSLFSLSGFVGYIGTLYYPNPFLTVENYLLPVIIGLAGLAIAYAGAINKKSLEKEEYLYSGACLAFSVILLLLSMFMTWQASIKMHWVDEIMHFTEEILGALLSGASFYFAILLFFAGTGRLVTNLWKRCEKFPLPF